MPTNQIYRPDRNLSKYREVGPNVRQGTAVLIDGRPGVTDADSGGSTRTNDLVTDVTITYPSGGAGYEADHALVHFDGTFELEVEGVTASTDSGVKVYLKNNGDLTTTKASNDFFGLTDYPKGYAKVAGRAPVQIGVAE